MIVTFLSLGMEEFILTVHLYQEMTLPQDNFGVALIKMPKVLESARKTYIVQSVRTR